MFEPVSGEIPVEGAQVLTRATLEATFEQLWHMQIPRELTPEQARELRVARWLETQPPGTASRLLDEAIKLQEEERSDDD